MNNICIHALLTCLSILTHVTQATVGEVDCNMLMPCSEVLHASTVTCKISLSYRRLIHKVLYLTGLSGACLVMEPAGRLLQVRLCNTLVLHHLFGVAWHDFGQLLIDLSTSSHDVQLMQVACGDAAVRHSRLVLLQTTVFTAANVTLPFVMFPAFLAYSEHSHTMSVSHSVTRTSVTHIHYL